MYEIHQNEQYFFDKPTLTHLTTFLSKWDAPCVVCAPLLGMQMVEAGMSVRILDIDDRFTHLPGFQHFDIARPTWLGEPFDIIVCDPPFYNSSLSQLFRALRILSRYDLKQTLMISYLKRRAHAILGTFAPFGLTSTGYFPGYQTVRAISKNEIEFFGNLTSKNQEMLTSG